MLGLRINSKLGEQRWARDCLLFGLVFSITKNAYICTQTE